MNNPKTRKIPLLLLLLLTCSLSQAAVSTVVTASFCEPTNYLFGCHVYTTTGVYYDTLPSAALTDSVIELRLTIGHTDLTLQSATIKQGESYLLGCKTLTPVALGDTIAYDTLENVTGCDSVIKLTLTVEPLTPPCAKSSDTEIAATIDLGQSYLFGCEVLTPVTAGDTTAYDSLKNVCGSDSVIVLTLHVNSSVCPKSADTPLEATIDLGQSYLFGCAVLTPSQAGDTIAYDSLKNVCGSDSVIVLTLHVNSTSCPKSADTPLEATIDLGQSYLFGCAVLTPVTAGDTIAYDSLKNVCGSDSVIVLTLHVNSTSCVPSPDTNLKDTMMIGPESYLFGCQVFTPLYGGDTILTDTLQNVCGEDSVIVLQLHVIDVLPPTPCTPGITLLFDTILLGQSYLFGCQTITPADTGSYDFTDDLKKVGSVDCDSTVYLTLRVNPSCVPSPVTNISASITSDESFLFGCQPIITPTAGTHVYKDSLKNVCGEDSVVILTLNVYDASCPPTASSYNDTVQMNQDYLFGCTVYNFAMVCDTALHDTLPNSCGSDSVITLNLHVYGYAEVNKTDTVCTGSTFRGHTITADNTLFSDTTATLVPGTPDTITHWTVYIYDTPVPARMDSLATVSALPTAKQGCVIDVDPAILINYLNAHPATGKTDSVVDIEWQYKTDPGASFEPIDNTTKLGKDIDSIIVHYVITEIKCGTTVLHGGDTVIHTSAYDYRESTEIEQDTICDGDTLTWRGHKLAVAGIHKDTITKSETTCSYDSIYVLNLTVQTATVAPAADTIMCEADATLAWRDKTWAVADTTYYDTLFYATGCDSIIYTLNVAVQKVTKVDAIDTIMCEADATLTWRDKILPVADTTYYDTLFYAKTHCDSIIYTLNVAVQKATDAPAIDTTACEADATLSWRGKTWPVADTTYYDTLFYSKTLCDSIRYTLNVTVQKAVDATPVDTFVCEADATLSWRGKTWPVADTTYRDTVFYTTGCDSIRYTLNVTVQRAAYATVEKDTICPGDTYTWRGYTFDEAGTYYDTLYYSKTNCDSLIYQLDLAVWTVQKTDSLPAGAEYGMLLLVNRVKLRQDWNIDLKDDMTDKVLWYRVVGAVDEWADITTHLDPVNPADEDVFLGKGFYYTDGNNILPDQYYAVIDWALPADAPCYTIWRTEILTPQTPESAPIRLLPNRVANGQSMLLTGIDLNGGTTTVRMLSASGQTVETLVIDNQVQLELTAEGVPGVYLLRVDNETQHETLKYIIVK